MSNADENLVLEERVSNYDSQIKSLSEQIVLYNQAMKQFEDSRKSNEKLKDV